MNLEYTTLLEILVTELDIPYEEAIAKKPKDLDNWLNYYNYKLNISKEPLNLVFILERAVKSVDNSLELWLLYLDLLLLVSEDFSFKNNQYELEMIDKTFTRALSSLPLNEQIWIKYLHFLMEYEPSQVTKTRRSFNKALQDLKFDHHDQIWPLYIKFADKIGGLTASTIYTQYLYYDPTLFDLTKFIQFDKPNSVGVLKKLIENPLNLSKSVLDLWLDYIDVIFDLGLENESKNWDKKVEDATLKAIADFPDQLGVLYQYLTRYYIGRDDQLKARFYFDQALKKCVSVPDFIMIYNDYVDFEEELLDDIDKNSKEFDSNVSHFETLLSNHGILLNDVRLRKDINDLDVWFDRLKLYDNDLDKKLKTYAMSLTNINPLQSHSSSADVNHTLSKLWIDYAETYSAKGDLKTANVIYSKAATSAFLSTHQLSEIYIKWSETLLESPVNPEKKAISVIEDVLVKPINVKNAIEAAKLCKLRESPELWNYYFDLLEAMIDGVEESKTQIEHFIRAHEKCIELKLSTPKMLLDFAATLHGWKMNSKCYSVYERAIELFSDPFMTSELWLIYIRRVLDDELDHERLVSIFEDSLFNSERKIAGIRIKSISLLYLKYLDAKREHGYKICGVLRRVVKRVITSINEDSLPKEELEQAYLDKSELYKSLISRSLLIDDVSFKREIFEDILNDTQLRLVELVDFAVLSIDFEIEQKNLRRSRALFEHITKLCNPRSGIIKPVWDKWESFEIEQGDEHHFKEIGVLKRQLFKEYENDTAYKASINPIGFVKSDTVNGVTKQAPEKNPEQIDIDMDM